MRANRLASADHESTTKGPIVPDDTLRFFGWFAPHAASILGADICVWYMRSRNGSGTRYSDNLEADDVMHAAGSRGGFALGRNNGYARFGSASAYAEERAREERRTLNCVVGTLLVAVVLIVSGVSVMHGADYTRTKMRVVEGYDEVVDRWTNAYSEEFAQTRFDVVIGNLDAVSTRATHEVTPIDHANGIVHEYYPTAFEVSSLLEQAVLPSLRANETMRLPTEGWTVPNAEPSSSEGADGEINTQEPQTPSLTPEQERMVFEYLTVPRELVVRASPRIGEMEEDALRKNESGVDLVPLGAFALVEKTRRRSNGWKACKYQHGGYFRAGMCTTYTVLDTLCVKVSKDSEKGSERRKWTANATYGGPGCDPRREWRVESKKITRAPPGGSDPTLSNVRRLGSGRVIIRSAHDPLMAAMNLTEGSMFFAEKQASRSAAGVVLLVVGLAAAVPGLALGVPIATRRWRGREAIRKTRGEGMGRNANDFDDVL